jgi:hypothetical protein
MEEEIERGMKLAKDLPDIMPQDVGERLKPVYEDIQTSLRVPIVNKIFRSLANYPEYLEQAWSEIRPLIVTTEFEKSADALRRQALLNDAPQEPVIRLDDIAELDHLLAFNATIHYVLPKLLLTATLLHEASFGEVAGAKDRGGGEAAIPLGVADGTAKAKMLDAATADERVKTVFEQVKEVHGHSIVSSYFRGLANWPEFLERTWRELQGYVGSEAYTERRGQLTNSARHEVRRWGLPVVAIHDGNREEIKSILAAFRLKFIPEMLLDSVLITSLVSGREAAASSRFSVAFAD